MKYFSAFRKFSKVSEKILRGPEIKLTNESFGKILLQRLQKGGTNVAMVDATTEEKTTYTELLRRTVSLAQHLKTFGLKKNDVISINSENSLYFTIPVISALYLGIITAPMNHQYTKKELLHTMGISKPKLIFCSSDTLEKILDVKPQLKHIERIIVLNKTNKKIPKSVLKLEDLINLPLPEHFEVTPVKPDHTAVILCSSGTTGMPKGVMVTHVGLESSLHFFSHPNYCNFNSEKAGLGLLPMYHVYGYVSHLCMLATHMKLITLAKFEEKLFLETLQNYNITFATLIPPLVLLLSKSPLVTNYDLSKFKDSICGAAPLAKNIQENVMKILNVNIREGYGTTETLVTNITPYNTTRSNTVGILAPGVECKIIDIKSGEALGPNEPGELCFRSVQNMKGYLGNEKATTEALDNDGWLHTGDVGYYDEEEYFYIVDRLKEIIKFKGFQVPPAELEDILISHPDIQDCAVIGKPDEKAGELPLAFVVRKPNAKVTESEIFDFVTGKVSNQKKLRGGVRFIDAIPKNPTGKILRRILREQI